MRLRNSILLIKNFRTSFAFGQSPVRVVRKLLSLMDLEHSKTIVELGGGSGTITRAILGAMREDAVLITFEISQEMYDELKQIDDSRLKVVHGSAEGLSAVLKEEGIGGADCIISALPVLIMPNDLVLSIYNHAKDALASNGRFIQMQYHLQAYRWLKKVFHSVEISLGPNIPPAFLYVCQE